MVCRQLATQKNFLQVFDILPLCGTLDPGESQQVQLTFYGHTGVVADVVALCHVEGGQTHKLLLRGEASEMRYQIDKKKIDMGTIVRSKPFPTKLF